MQLQENLSDLQSELEMKTKELKQCKEDIKTLQKKKKVDTTVSVERVKEIPDQGN